MPDEKKPTRRKPARRSTASTGDRTRKAALATSAGAIPLAISLLAGVTRPGANPHPAAGRRAPIALAEVLFDPGCRMPFESSPIPPIDGSCGIEGAGTTDKKIAESKAKNDFCAPISNVIPINYQTFIDLQKATSFRSSADRAPLEKILTESDTTLGEGKFVEFAGFVLNAQYSNKSKGEAVNCNIPGEDTNDIHIELVKDSTEDDACSCVTAEMSPHFRPESWTPDKLNSTKGRLIRVRGPLFFDGSHAPCHDDKRPTPQRASVWEIHPVYSVDVCKQKGDTCQNWVPLDQWNGIEGDEEEEP